MKIIVDSREKPKATKSILQYFIKTGIDYDISKLYVGDYYTFDNPKVFIDRKQNIAELAQNATQGHDRFKKELERLDSIDGKMYILVEEKINSLEDVKSWVSAFTQLKGETLYKILKNWEMKHNIEYVFCDKVKTGREIVKLLRG